MQVMIRSWCCQLSTFVTVVAIIQTVVYLVIASLTVAWVVLPHTETVLPPTVDSYLWPGQSHLRQSVTVLIISLGVSFSGILSSSLLLVGVRTQSRYLLVPWVVVNVLVLLALVVTGSYLVMFFTLIKEEKEYVLAAISSSLILISMFLIFITILVVKLFIKMKQKQLLIRVASSFRGSRASINYNYNSNIDTVRSNRSGYSCNSRSTSENHMTAGSNNIYNKNNIDAPLNIDSNRSFESCSRSRSRKRIRHLSDQSKRSYQVHKKHKSRSQDQILDSSPSNSSPDDSLYQLQYSRNTKSLPRLRPSKEYPHFYQGEHASLFHHTDTSRSSKSVAIYPRVTKYHNTQSKEKVGVINEAFEDAEVVIEYDEEGSVPAPIFPTEKELSKNQIVDYYCAEGEFML